MVEAVRFEVFPFRLHVRRVRSTAADVPVYFDPQVRLRKIEVRLVAEAADIGMNGVLDTTVVQKDGSSPSF